MTRKRPFSLGGGLPGPAGFHELDAGEHLVADEIGVQAINLSCANTREVEKESVDLRLAITEAFQAPGPCPVGASVTVAPTDYGIDPVADELVAEYTNEWIVKRTDARAGTVHVHFPRTGYQIESA